MSEIWRASTGFSGGAAGRVGVTVGHGAFSSLQGDASWLNRRQDTAQKSCSAVLKSLWPTRGVLVLPNMKNSAWKRIHYCEVQRRTTPQAHLYSLAVFREVTAPPRVDTRLHTFPGCIF
jgi:hypothetical protein